MTLASIPRFRIPIFVFLLLTFVFSGVGLKQFTTTDDMRVFFGDTNPQLEAMERLESIFNKTELVYMAIAPKDGDVFTRETLRAIQEATEASWFLPYSLRVDSLTNFQHTRVDGDDLKVSDLVKADVEFSDEQLANIRETALNEPFLVHSQISGTGHVAAISVTVLLPGKSPTEKTEVTKAARAIVDDIENRYPNIKIYLSGSVVFDAAVASVTLWEALFYPAMLLLMMIMVYLTTRSFSAIFATLIVLAASSITAMGLACWFGVIMTPPTIVAPIIIFTVAVADSIHYITSLLMLLRQGKERLEAVIEALRVNLGPIFLTSITTAIGFLSMNASDSPPLRDMGNIVALGVIVAFIYSIFLLPGLMLLLPLRVDTQEGKTTRWMRSISDFVLRRRTGLLVGMIILVSFLALGIFRIELTDDSTEYFDTRYQARRDIDFIRHNITRLNGIEYSVTAAQPGGITEPEHLQHMQNFVDWMREQPEVLQVFALSEIMRRLNKAMHGDNPAYLRLPESRPMAAQYLLLFELSLPFGKDLNNLIEPDKSSSRMTVLVENITTSQIRALEERANRWLAENTPPGMFSPGTGVSVMFAHLAELNTRSMLSGTALALLLISGILVFALRSIKIGLISLIPNIIPAVMAFGLWGWLVGRVGLPASIIAAMTLGIVVDDTVHFLSKYMRARRELGMDAAEAVQYSFRTVGVALMNTSIILAMGFMVLAGSGFQINSIMGLLTAITIVFALMADFFLLAPLLMLVDRNPTTACSSQEN